MTSYELWYTDDKGQRIGLLDTHFGFSYTLSVGNVGWLTINLPNRGVWRKTNPDNLIQVWRKATNSNLRMEGLFLMRNWETTDFGTGSEKITISGPDRMEILSRRVTAYPSETPETLKYTAADDIMKEFVDENLVSATDTDRNVSTITVGYGTTEGVVIRKGASYKNLLRTLQEVQQISREQGVEIFFDLESVSDNTYFFRTSPGYLNNDRTVATGAFPLIFGLNFGNLTDVSYGDFYDEEYNFVYIGGRGKGETRKVSTAENTARSGLSQYGRREVFAQANNVEDSALVDLGSARLAEGRPRRGFDATILNTASTPYGGQGWKLGDKITLSHQGDYQSAIIREITVTVDPTGQEFIDAGVEVVE